MVPKLKSWNVVDIKLIETRRSLTTQHANCIFQPQGPPAPADPDTRCRERSWRAMSWCHLSSQRSSKMQQAPIPLEKRCNSINSYQHLDFRNKNSRGKLEDAIWLFWFMNGRCDTEAVRSQKIQKARCCGHRRQSYSHL